MKDDNTLIPIEETSIINLIYTIRGKQVMIDRDLADLSKSKETQLDFLKSFALDLVQKKRMNWSQIATGSLP